MSAPLKTRLARAFRGLTSAEEPSVAPPAPAMATDLDFHPLDATFLLDDPAIARLLDKAEAVLESTPSAQRPALFA
ncbi:MAG: hypothetical protein JWP92_2023, partial [Caulobacter sp.]|nr:hypothetical protein [Caulobacter sp.]